MPKSQIESVITTDSQLLPLSEAFEKVLPKGSKTPSYMSRWRWANHGIRDPKNSRRRVKLEIVLIGRRPYTTREAIFAFAKARGNAR